MSDFRNDPNFVRHEMNDIRQPRAVGRRCGDPAAGRRSDRRGGLTGGDSQTAMNGPAVETTGSGGSLGFDGDDAAAASVRH